jgi:hypothetical protein
VTEELDVFFFPCSPRRENGTACGSCFTGGIHDGFSHTFVYNTGNQGVWCFHWVPPVVPDIHHTMKKNDGKVVAFREELRKIYTVTI